MEELQRIFNNLILGENMEQNQGSPLKVVNDPPIFSGRRKELDGFLTRVDLAIEANPNRFQNDDSRVRFLMSYFIGRSLEWASCLRRNNNEVIHNYNNFVQELRNNYGDPNLESIVAKGKLCNIKQRSYGRVLEYITEFQRISQNSDFNEPAKIYMFIRGLHFKLRQQLATVNPNPNNLNRLINDVIANENLSKRQDINEFYIRNRNQPSSSHSAPRDDPMEVDLYRIKQGYRDVRYFPSHNSLYVENTKNYDEERRKGLCFLCKQPGHLQFNCPNRKRPKGLKMINKKNENNNQSSATLRRIRRILNNENVHKVSVKSYIRNRLQITNFNTKIKKNK